MIRPLIIILLLTKCSFSENVSLKRAVDEFNKSSYLNKIGKVQDILTVEEIITNIRAIEGGRVKLSSEAIKTYQELAKHKVMPAGCFLRFVTEFNSPPYKIKCWRVELIVNDQPKDLKKLTYSGYRKYGSLTLRDVKFSSQMHGDLLFSNGTIEQFEKEVGDLPVSSIDGKMSEVSWKHWLGVYKKWYPSLF